MKLVKILRSDKLETGIVGNLSYLSSSTNAGDARSAFDREVEAA